MMAGAACRIYSSRCNKTKSWANSIGLEHLPPKFLADWVLQCMQCGKKRNHHHMLPVHASNSSHESRGRRRSTHDADQRGVSDDIDLTLLLRYSPTPMLSASANMLLNPSTRTTATGRRPPGHSQNDKHDVSLPRKGHSVTNKDCSNLRIHGLPRMPILKPCE